MSKDKLTPKQSLFVKEYLVDLNASQAAIRAGYSEETADRIGHENLKKLEIQKAINEAMKERAERLEISQDKVLKEIALIAFGRLSNVLSQEENGEVYVDLSNMSESDKALLAEVQSTRVTQDGDNGSRETVSVKVKANDRLKALDMLMRHLGAYNDKIEVEGNVNIAPVLAAARKRLGGGTK